ncbi:MAG TPA: thiamine phosphate synthase [Hyphomicrobium sp.]|nr:thiamine phosphate synthase [Hyphomicrobium sp.]
MTDATVPQLDIFYPIVPDAAWAARIVPLGVRTLQLRVKDASADEVRRQIDATLALTRRHGCQLIVNDYWREAIAAGADCIHLGQEDLAEADVAAIKAAGLRLGVSTHSEEELAIALAAGPDYVALGPIYETKLKVMRWAPQGLPRIGEWKRRIGALPLVAIGGITPERAAGVVAAGADSVAVITDFMTAQEPEKRIEKWLTWAEERRVVAR